MVSLVCRTDLRPRELAQAVVTLLTHSNLLAILQLQWMVDGRIMAPVPKVVRAEFRPELAPILRLRTVVGIVRVPRANGATRNPARVWLARVDFMRFSTQ